jgi:excisionase family DNA binding protein
MTTAEQHLLNWAQEAIRPVIKEMLRGELADIIPQPNPENSEQRVLLNVQQAAELLNRKPATIYGLVYEKRIPYYKPDGRLQFIRSELMDWVKGNLINPNKDIDEMARKVITKRASRRKNAHQQGRRDSI